MRGVVRADDGQVVGREVRLHLAEERKHHLDFILPRQIFKRRVLYPVHFLARVRILVQDV